MAKRKDPASTDSSSLAGTPADSGMAKAAAPEFIGPTKPAAFSGSAQIALSRLSAGRIDLSGLSGAPRAASPSIERPAEAAPAIEPQARTDEPDFVDRTPQRAFASRAALAASLAFAMAIGAVAGGAAGHYVWPSSNAATPVPSAADEVRALRETVVRLSTDMTALQARIDNASRSTSAQIGKLGERIDRVAKADAEPAAKLAKMSDALDRMERRLAAAPDVTGSVTAVAKTSAQPPQPSPVDGWRLRQFFGGRALVESRTGELYEVGPGASLPGLGRVESIRRQDGKVIVVTAKGQIAGAPEPRRMPMPPPRYMQYRY